MITVKYCSNNSGGDWWLTDKDWKKLEKAGWTIKWHSLLKPRNGCDLCQGTGKITKKAAKKHTYLKEGDRCFSCFKGDNAGRWLGGLAKEAQKKFKNITEALKEFEKITGQSVTDEGCSCCGPPHAFEWRTKKDPYMYCSGEGCLPYLYPGKKIPTSVREAIEQEEEKLERA